MGRRINKNVSKRNAVIDTCYDVVERLVELEVTEKPDSYRLDDASLEKVLGIITDVPPELRQDVFWELDEKPGTFGFKWDGKEWHYKLRQLRNNPTLGKRMFAAFRGET